MEKSKKRKATAGEQLATQVGEFFDPYTDRTYLDEPGSTGRVVMQPGKMLDKLRERMERVVLDPLNIEVAVEDFLTFDEVSMLVSNTFGGLLVAVTAEHAADLLAREFPRDLGSQPILSYDTRSVGLDIRDDLQAIARDILNSQTSEDPRRDVDQVDEQVSGLAVGDQCRVAAWSAAALPRAGVRLTKWQGELAVVLAVALVLRVTSADPAPERGTKAPV